MPHFGDPGVDLPTWQLTPLTGLGTLCHLNLQLFGLGQVIAGHPKAPRRHLLNRAVPRIAVGVKDVARRVFPAFACIALAANAVHGNRQRLVRLFTDRTIRHGACLKPFHDRLDGLYFVKWHWLPGVFEFEQAAQRRQTLCLVVDELGEFFKGGIIVGAAGFLQQVDGSRVKQVQLSVLAVLILTMHIEGMAIHRKLWKCLGVLLLCLVRDFR